MVTAVAQRIFSILAIIAITMTISCSHPTPNSTPPPAKKPVATVRGPVNADRIDEFLGISRDFKLYAIWTSNGVTIVDFDTGKPTLALTWDRDWGHPLKVAFGNNVIAIVTCSVDGAGNDNSPESVKFFSAETAELQQNIRGQINCAAFTDDGKFLAVTEFVSGSGYRLLLRDIDRKKNLLQLPLGRNGYCSLAVKGNRLAAYESSEDQITVVEADTAAAMQKPLKSGSFRERAEFGGSLMPLAISPSGALIACGADDAVVLYDFERGSVVRKIEGHLDVIRAVAFSPDGKTVASAGKDKTIRFWNANDGKEVQTIKNIPIGVSELFFSADGKRIAFVYGGDKFHVGATAEIRSIALKRSAH